MKNYEVKIIKMSDMDIAVAESIINAIRGRKKKYGRMIEIALSPLDSDKMYRLSSCTCKGYIYDDVKKESIHTSIDEMANIMRDIMYSHKNERVYINISV